jgi:ATP-dependent DNA ligase
MRANLRREGGRRAKPLADFPMPIETPPMEAVQVDALPRGPAWQYEPKWDGFRCLVFKAGDAVELRAKSGKPLARFFPEMAAAVRARPEPTFVLDGELVIPIDGTLSFAALQDRLHPAASRVEKLARAHPSLLVAFDCLADARGASLFGRPLSERRARLVRVLGQPRGRLRLSPATHELAEAERWLGGAAGAVDGVIAKRLDEPYAPGERRMLKVKRLRTADCVIGGFRYGEGTRTVGSLLLGLYNGEGLLDHVGFTSGLSDKEKPELTRRLEKIVKPPGFTGRAPGGPSRWSSERSAEWVPLAPELVVEVRYDHVTADRFRHGTKLVRWRPDKAPRQCTMEQLAPTHVPPSFLADVLRMDVP